MSKLFNILKRFQENLTKLEIDADYDRESREAFGRFIDKINNFLFYLFVLVSFVCISFFIGEMCFDV